MTSTVQITRVDRQNSSITNDQLAVEEPLQIQLLYGSPGKEQFENLAITMRTPGDDAELAAGFLYTELILQNRKQIINIVPEASGSNSVLVILQSSLQTSTTFRIRQEYYHKRKLRNYDGMAFIMPIKMR